MRILTPGVLATLALLLIAAPSASAGVLDRVTGALDGERTAGSGFTLGGKPCEPIPPAPVQAPPVGVGACPGVRPGAAVISDLGQCTLNFLFSGADGERYIGTAGHCVIDEGEASWAPGAGPEARDGSGGRIGEFAYAAFESPRDFALIRLDAGVEADAAMCHFGGPTGINSSNPGPLPPTVLHHFGAGILVGDLVPGRSALAAGMPADDHVFATGVVTPGDSGSGVVSADGGAVGVAVTVGAHLGSLGTGGVDAGTVGITRIEPQTNRAANVLGTALTLETAPLG